ncbi:hypothetical protein CRYUN_Cryun04dG0108000 [Craigia yunnanensis]
MFLSFDFCILMQVVTLLVLMIHTFFPISYEGFLIYWKRPLNQLKIYWFMLFICPQWPLTSLPFRVAPYVRVIIFILNIRKHMENENCEIFFISRGLVHKGITSEHPHFGWNDWNILECPGLYTLLAPYGPYQYARCNATWLLFLLFASWVAYVMFEETQEGKLVFTSFGTTLYQMFVLFATSNNPDVWIPAYKASRWYCLFFVLYVLVGVYFVTNLILAVVYDSFKSQLAKQVSEMDRMRRSILYKAFELIDDYNVGFLNKEQCIHLLEELNKYRTLPKISREEFELIFDELDDSRDFKIDLDEFTDLCNAIALRFQKEDSPSIFERFQLYKSPFSENLKAFIRSPKFGYVVSFILILNLFAVIIETTLDIENNSAQKVWQKVEFVFVIGETITFASPDALDFFSNGES